MASYGGRYEVQGNAPIGFEMLGIDEHGDGNGINAESHKCLPSDGEERTLFFSDDGSKRIDYVFAYNVLDVVDEKKQSRRALFEDNLRKTGLILEKETIKYDEHDKVVYVKVSAPWSVLAAQAEIMNMKMPIAKNDMSTYADSWWKKIPSPFYFDEDILPVIPDYFTAAFSRDRKHQFIITDEDTFFSPAQRSLLTYQILCCTVFEAHLDKAKAKFGLTRMISSGAYDAAYPLHEGDFHSEHSILTRGKANNRHLLYETWARFGAWFKYQPLDHIRCYFGEKIAIYFCWLGYYTSHLIPAALVGFFVTIFGLVSMSKGKVSEAICDVNGPGGYLMCPLCDQRCDYWYLERSCSYSTVSHVFDNEGTVFFAAFMAVWATFFIEMWKRQMAEIVYDWDVADFEEEETVRPEFEASVKHHRVNPINKTEEPYLSYSNRVCRFLSSLWVVVFMLAIVSAAVFGVIVYRITISVLLFSVNQDEISRWSSTITSATAACINLICIILLGRIYMVFAKVLTNFEMHRTQTEWEDSFTLKMFLFQFVNYYSSLFYIGFFKGKFAGSPGNYNREINNKRQEECDPSGCQIELLIQLVIIMIGKQTINNSKEVLIPKLMNWFKSRRMKDENAQGKNCVALWEKGFNMAAMPDLGLFEEYLEMVIQYGFVTIFVAAFPLAPLFALLNNILEIRLDAYKFVTQWRRPMPARAQDIGIWFEILKSITTIAVASNAALIAFTSEFVPKLVYKYGYSETGTMDGYMDFSLSLFNVGDFETGSSPLNSQFKNVTTCRYRDWRESYSAANPYVLTGAYWHVLTGRLAFVIVFILVVVFLQWLIAFLVPDVPKGVKIQMLREKYLAKESRLEAELLRKDSSVL